MIVSSKLMARAAAEVRERDDGPQVLKEEGVAVSAEQCEAVARILRDADPCVCNGLAAERPGFIEGVNQDPERPDVLVFQLGILPATEYRIARDGEVLEARGGSNG